MNYDTDFEIGQEQLEIIMLDLQIRELEKEIQDLKEQRKKRRELTWRI